ncbi:hypothetical protein ACHAXS_001919 [Conticribra weissflogii]
MSLSWTFMVQVSLHWSECGADNLALWNFAMKHAVWHHNHIPSHLLGLTHVELLTNIKANHCDLIHPHV